MDILIFGASGHACVVIDAVEKQGCYRIAGLLDPNLPVGEECMGYPVLGRDEDLPTIMKLTGAQGAIVAVGDNALRKKVVENAVSFCPEIAFVTVIHPASVVSRTAIIELGALIMPGAIINAKASVGQHAIVNSLAVVEHECVVGDFCHIAPGAVLGGNVSVGEGSLVGIGARVLPGKTIGSCALLGAGGIAVADIPSNTTWAGSPARQKK
ncbi:MAG: acetyltransferase [Desulfovibrio sp.]|jgi:sugar O-acyltransferase (sialic acid O-acetyltransferase NeuD family)